jgi:molecular chaperone HtpG
LRSLQDYVAALKPGQSAIYYLVGDSRERLKANPKLEAARARDIEVLLLTDPVDAFWTSLALSFEGKPLKSLSQGDVDFGESAPGETAASAPTPTAVDTAVVIAAIKGVLGERVSEVRASNRLVDSAACLVASGQGPDRELQRLLSLQKHNVGGAKPILEINTGHALIRGISEAKFSASDDLPDLCELLFDQALILDGDVPNDPASFTKRMNRFVVRGLLPLSKTASGAG